MAVTDALVDSALLGLAEPVDWWPVLVSTVSTLAMPTVASLVVVFVTLFAGQRIRQFVQDSLRRSRAEPSVILLVARLSYFAVLTLGVVWVLAIYGLPPTALIATLGFASLAVSLSLQDVLKNLVAGLYLLVEKPFRIGDRLVIRTYDGVVEDVDVRITTLRMASGERVLVPNAILFAEVLVNKGAPLPAPSEDTLEPG